MESAFKGLNLKDMLVFEGSQQEILPPLPDLTWFVFRLYVFFQNITIFFGHNFPNDYFLCQKTGNMIKTTEKLLKRLFFMLRGHHKRP